MAIFGLLTLMSVATIVNCLPRQRLTDNPKSYDYIIIGAGSAGSVLANRLTENPNVQVLLLESGGPPTIESEIPFIVGVLQLGRLNWKNLAERQDNFGLGLVNQRMHWAKGRALGGSSVINYMIHIRGNKEDYNRWARMGNPGWSYEEVLPYFLKSEDSIVKIQDDGYHRQGGLLSARDVPYRTKSVDMFVEGCQEAGYPYVDYNGKTQLGVSYVQSTTRDGLRCSAEKAFIRPARRRPNLEIRLNSHVGRVLIHPRTKMAYGVEYHRWNKTYVANASVEVILSAGTVNSAQILMLSGIGPKDHLVQLGIQPLVNLPVGQKLYDHLAFLGLMFTVNKPIVYHIKDIASLSSIWELIYHGRGPLTGIGGIEGLAFFKTNVTTSSEDVPDVELIFLGGGLQLDYGIVYKTMLRITNRVYNAIWRPLADKNAFSIYPILLHPKSFGNVKLRSKNTFDPPLIYPNYLTDPEQHDLKVMLAAIRESQRILTYPAFQKYQTRLFGNPIPGCEKHRFDSDSYWECGIRHLALTLYHPTSTCKMGPTSDPEAVVDSKLRVYGVERLRVVDNSIVPLTLTAHVNVPAYMIGEKGADLIKEDYQKFLRYGR